MEVKAQVILAPAEATAQDAPPRSAMAAAGPTAVVAASKGAGRSRGWRWSPLKLLTAGSRTNADMLLFRTLNRDMGVPNHNADDLAPLFRNALSPMRSRWFATAPGARGAFRRALEHPKLGAPGVVNWVDARTSAFDKVVQSAIDDGLAQVVVVAAGFDTRSYRFGAAAKAGGQDVTFFEVDLPGASSKKKKLVEELLPSAAYPRPTFVAADLSVTPLMDALGAAGFDFTVPTLFTIEGLIYYLPEARVVDLLATITTHAAPGSRIAFDSLCADVLSGSVAPPPAYKVTARSVANKGEPFLSGLPSSAAGMQGFLDGPVAMAAAHLLQLGACLQRLELTDFCTARELASRHLPHLTWPAPGSTVPPPILSFYNFCCATVQAAAKVEAAAIVEIV